MVWYGPVRSGLMRQGEVGYGMAWWDSVWLGLVGQGKARYKKE
jgi:hypothetical protein